MKIKDLKIHYSNKVLIENGKANFYKGKLHLITGKSGSGKSTLLYRLGLISRDIDFKYFIDDQDILALNETQKSDIRRFNISYVLQDYSLFEQYDVLGNLQLYSSFINKNYTEKDFVLLLEMVHLDVPFHQSIETLSGGERQRLAIACALCKDSDILILDEPTNSLDDDNTTNIFKLLRELARVHNKCVIVSSHNELAKEYVDITYKISQGEILSLDEETETSHFSLSINNIRNKIDFKFYINYIKYFQKKFYLLNNLILTVMVVMLLASILSVNIIDFYTNKSKNEIVTIGDNQLFITNSKKDIFVDDLDVPLEKEKIQRIIDEKECQFSSPYISLTTTYLDKKIVVLPYYDENDFDALELCKLDTRDNKGLYFSYDLYTSFVKNNNTLKSVDLEFEVKNFDGVNESSRIKRKLFPIRAALKEGYVNPYFQSNGYFIYMYYKDVVNIYTEFYNEGDFLGYTIFTENYQDLLILEEKLNNLSIGINNKFIDANTIDKIIKTGAMYRNILVIGIVTIFAILLIAMQMNYFYKRDREYALLKINGLNHKNLVKLSMIEILSKMLIAIVISITLYLFVMIIILCLNTNIGEVNISIAIHIYLMSASVIVISEFGATYYYLKKMIPENILRK